MKRFHKLLAATAIALLLFSTPAVSQKAPDLPVDDLEVYQSFFLFMDNFTQWLDGLSQKAPARKQAIEASAARFLKVDVKELPNLSATCKSLAAKLRQADADARQYVSDQTAKKSAPDRGILQQFQSQRQAAIQAGVDQLQHTLSAASWNGLHSHINGQHRESVHKQ